MEGLTIRAMCPGDAGFAVELAARSPEAAQWTAADYERLGSSGVEPHGFVAQNGSAEVGFIVWRQVGAEMEILNLAVAPEFRRGGVGSALLEAALAAVRAADGRTVYLEVRQSNRAAQIFYTGHGFVHTGRRASYYQTPVEDALVLSRVL